MTQEHAPHIVGYGKLTAVWLALLALTVLTVWISRLDLGVNRVWGSLAIASAKAGLVIAFFMHMKYEGRLLRWLLFVALLTLAIFIGFTFFDVLYR
jgi:cytochrome c oxidase subunit IV